ncbi:MAG: MBL fold metallo-hydrolase, partial [Kiritimatiellae bacterium]|nr:MBL fold metallo-hydrolase [Kiritimatiellia bacterium]
MKITDDILYVGVNDHDVDLFEGQFEVPLGMAYNSYVVKAQKVAVMDTVDVRFGDEWLKNVAAATDRVDYLVVQHMEPDHSANIARFAEAYPDAKIVSSMPAFGMMKNYFGTDFADRRVVVKEGDSLDLGGRSLAFVGAPMVLWPEVIVTWDAATGTLFSADGFG